MAWRTLELRDRRLVGVEAQPMKSVDDRPDRRFGRALAVRVLDPQQHLAARLAGVQPVEERRARAADVKIACRRRCEPGYDAVCHGRPRRWHGAACRRLRRDCNGLCRAGETVPVFFRAWCSIARRRDKRSEPTCRQGIRASQREGCRFARRQQRDRGSFSDGETGSRARSRSRPARAPPSPSFRSR